MILYNTLCCIEKKVILQIERIDKTWKAFKVSVKLLRIMALMNKQ